MGPDGIWWGIREQAGPACLHLAGSGSEVIAEAWGPGAGMALARAGALIGLEDDPAAFVPHDAVLAALHRRLGGVRLPRTGRIWEALLPAICEQKVTGVEARESFRAIVHRWGEPAPGPGGRLAGAATQRAAPAWLFRLPPLRAWSGAGRI